MTTAKCTNCGREFTANHSLARFCSPECRKEARRSRQRERVRIMRGSPEQGATITAKCKCCGQTFDYPHKGRRRTVCDTCRALGVTRRRRAGAKNATSAPPAGAPRRTICLFCGQKFVTRYGNEFCGHCRRERFDVVYATRKAASGGNWTSEGDKARRRAEEGL